MNCALNKKFIVQKHTCMTKAGMYENVGVLAMLAMRAGCRNVEVLAMLTMLADVRGVQKTTRLSRRKTGCKNLNMYRNNTA